MISVFRVKTRQAEGDEIGIYRKYLNIFSENHKTAYEAIKSSSKGQGYILLCMKERWSLNPPETNFGLASLEPVLGEVFWRSWTTVNMQRQFNPNIPEEPTFKSAFKRCIKEYLDQKLSKTPTLVSDEYNFQRCLDVLNEMGLEYKIMSEG